MGRALGLLTQSFCSRNQIVPEELEFWFFGFFAGPDGVIGLAVGPFDEIGSEAIPSARPLIHDDCLFLGLIPRRKTDRIISVAKNWLRF